MVDRSPADRRRARIEDLPARTRLALPGLRRPATFPRIAYAAAHVVADPLADLAPWQQAAVDWDATLAFRRHLWGLGFKIAEAMDTSQRGMGLDWPTARELIRRSLRRGAHRSPGADLACGVGTDQLAPGAGVTLDDVRRAYEEQLAGGRGRAAAAPS